MLKKLMSFLTSYNYYCPICCNKEGFAPLSDYYRNKYIEYGFKYLEFCEMTSLETYTCSKCGASDRDRLYAFWLKRKLAKNSSIKMLHFAPEKSLSKWIKDNYSFEYETADLMMEGVNHKVDMLDMPFEDDSYDSFICSHVLEHVNDDYLAVSELYRILKPGGWGILMAPICTAIDNTLEDKNHKTDEDRWKYYGQNDHLRLYSHNGYLDVISSTGFKVKQLGIEYFGSKSFKQLGLNKTSILYIVEKQ